MSSFPDGPKTLKFFVIVFQHEYVFHRAHMCPTHLFWDKTYNITPLSPLHFMVQTLELQAFQNFSHRKVFLTY